MDVVLNAFAVIASLLSLVLPLQLLRYGQPRSKEERRRLVRIYTVCWLVGGVLLSFFGVQFTRRTSTATQAGDFANYPTGVSEVIYAIPYKAQPHVRGDLKSRFSISGSAEIVEQRSDGFKVRLGSYGSGHWKW